MTARKAQKNEPYRSRNDQYFLERLAIDCMDDLQPGTSAAAYITMVIALRSFDDWLSILFSHSAMIASSRWSMSASWEVHLMQRAVPNSRKAGR